MTRFRLDESRLVGQKAQLRCSRCQHTFPAPRVGKAPAKASDEELKPAPPPEAPPPVERDNLSFPFDDENGWQGDSPEDEDSEEGQFALTIPSDEASDARPNQEPEDDGEQTTVSVPEVATESEEEEDEGTVSVRPVFVFLLLVITAYAVLAGTLYANPHWTDQVVQEMPLVGHTRAHSMNRKVLLVKLEGAYQQTKAGKNILIVTGYAINQAEVALTSIQIQTQLLDTEGGVVADRIVFCDSTVPRKLLRDLTLAEVSIIGRLKPPRTFLLQPGERSPFMAVFADPPPTVTEFKTRVVVAQRQV